MSLYDLTQLQNKTLQEQTQEIREINDRKPVVSKLPEQTDLVGRAQEYEQKVRKESLQVNYGLTLNANQYQTIANAMAASDNPSETEAKFAQALVYSQEYGMDLTTAVENLDSLNNARFGHTVPYTKAGYQAVVDSLMIGHYGIKLAELADQRYEIEKQGGDSSAVKFEMQQINQWIEDHQDYADRDLVTTLLKLGAQSVPYTMKIFTTGAAAGGVAAGLGALVGGPAGAAVAGTIYKWVSTGAGFLKGVQLVRRAQYYDLVDNGVDPEIAEWTSAISAGIQSAVEQFLGIEGGINSAISHLASGTTTKILAGMYAKGTFRRIASVAAEYFKTGVSEGLEEFIQQITEDVSNNIAYELSEIPEGKKTTKEVIHNAVQSFVGGFGASLVLGIAPTAINTKASLRYAQDIRTDAQETDSRQSFINKHKSDEQFEGFSAKTVNDTLAKIYDNARETMTSEERGADVISNEEAATIEVGEDQGTEELLDEQGNIIEEVKATSKQPVKPLTRTSEGRLVTKESADVRLQADGSEKHILFLGGTESQDVYGRVEYTFKDNTVTIDRVTSFSGYEDIQSDGIKELMRRYEGYDFEWDPNTEAQEKIKSDLLSGNPLQNGKLNWFDGSYNAKTSVEVGRIVGQAFTNLTEEQKATAGTMLQIIADSQGMDVNTFLKNKIQEFGSIDAAGKRGAFQMLKDNEGNFKAVIYAGNGHDYSSFAHETFHLVRQISNKSSELAAAFKASADTEQFKKFSLEHWNILGQYFDSFDEIKSAIESFKDGEKWTRDQEELAALYFEAYQQEGKTFSEKLKNLFQKISEWFSRIYNTMKHNTQLNDDIIKAYDAMLESNEQLRQENAVSESENDSGHFTIGVKEVPAWMKEAFGEPSSETGSDVETRTLEDEEDNGLDENGNPLFQGEVQINSTNFKEWFGDWEKDPESASKVVDENGKPQVVYHGTARGDRVGEVFDPNKATSGPMAFFTTDESVAEGYSKNKSDTSLDYDPAYEWENRFRVKIEGWGEIRVQRAWNLLTKEQRAEITERAKHIVENEDGVLVYDESVSTGNGSFTDYELNRNRGNAIAALWQSWIENGELFREDEVRFLEVLKLSGFTDMVGGNVWYNNPYITNPRVYDVYLSIKNPFDTTTVDEKFVTRLENWFKRQPKWKYEKTNYSADIWDKNSVEIDKFAHRLREDIKDGTTTAWTSIPDFVTDYLKYKGYDGIKDIGGKYHPNTHTVWIPFQSNQIKSASGNTGAFDPENDNIYFQESIKKADDEYFKAIKDSNLEAAQRIVYATAKSKGYFPESDYQGTSAFNGIAPAWNGYTREERLGGEAEGDYSLGDYKAGIESALDVFFNNPYYSRRGEFEAESIQNLKNGLEKGMITIYRSVPSSVKEGNIRNGDWVTPSKKYAIDNAEIHGWSEGYRIIEQNVSIDNLWWDENDINEWGYDDQKEYAYKNTENNIKSLDVITRDKNGNIIPLSERFNPDNPSIYYQEAIDQRTKDNTDLAKDSGAPVDEQDNVTLYTDGQIYSTKQHKGFKKASVPSGNLEVSGIRGDEITYKVIKNGQVEYQNGPEVDMLAGFARVYDTYEEFKAEMSRPDFEFLISGFDDYELRAIWSQEHNFTPEVEFTDEEETAAFSRNEGYVSPVTEDMDEQQKTAAYRARISTDEGIRGFIMRLRQLADFNHESGGGRRLAAGSQEDYDNMMNELEIFGRVYREAAPFIRSLMFSKKEVSDKAILEVRGMMLKEENELMYRDLYADVMLDPNLRADVYNRVFDLNDPGFGYENKTIAQRAKMFSRQDTADWIAKVQSGQIKDPELKKHIENMIEERNSLREQLEEKTRTLSSVRTQLAKSERDHLQMIEDNAREANQLRNFIQKVQEKIGNGRRMTAEEFKKVNSASERIAILNEEMKQLRKDDKAKAAAERREAIYKAQTQIRNQYREKQEQISKAKELQEHKENLAHIITSPRLNEDVNWEQRAEIQAIAAAVDPNNRRDKIRVAGKLMTVPELRAAIERGDIKLENITPYMLTRLTKTPLNEWTVSELEEMAEYVESLRTLGKQIWQAKIDKRNMIAEQLRNQIIHTVQANRLHPETTPIPNSEEARQLEKKWRTKFKNTFNKTLGIDRKAQRLDNNTQGTAWDILVDQRRKLDNEEYQAIQKRVQPIYKLMEEKGIKPSDLYQKVPVYLDGTRTTMMTYSDLAYGLFAEKDPQTYEAFAYGDLVTQREKEFERAQTSNDDEWNDRIRRMGDDRYRNFKQAAQGLFYQHPEYLEFFQAIDDEWQKPENFERSNAVTQEEYNITQDKVEHYMRIYRTQQNGSQMAATQAAEMRAKYSPQSKSTPQKGQTKKRINISPAFQTPTRMDMLGTWLKSVEENEHLIIFTPWVRQMNRIFKNRGSEYLRSEIQATFGSGMMNDINSYINEVARPQAFNEDTGLDGLVRVLRGGIYTGYLGAKASSVVLQGITSPMPFLRFVNPVQLAKGIIDFTTHPVESWRMITALSPFMERRSMNPTVEEIRQDAAEGGNGKVKKAYHKVQNAVMQPLEWIDRWAVASGWLAVYNKKLSEFEYQNDIESMKEAAHYADTVVYQTQPNGVSSELAPMFKGSGAVKIFTQFQTALNTIWQNVAYDTVQDFSTSRKIKKSGNESYKHFRNRGLMTLIGYSTAGLLLALVTEGFDDDDEDKDKLKKLLAGTTSQITDSVPLVGSYITSLLKTVITGENQPSISSSLYPGFDRVVSGIKTGLAGENKLNGWYNAAQGAGLLVGFPVNGIKEWYAAVTGDPQVLLGRDKK